MKRRTFDILMAAAGLLLAVTLIGAGVLLSWGHSVIGNEVHTQLAAQKIFFRVPPATDILTGHPANPAPVTAPAVYAPGHQPTDNGLVAATPASSDSPSA